MAEDKKASPTGGEDLASKIAKAYRSMPEGQWPRAVPDEDDIQNPELDKAFDNMVAMYKVPRPERESAVVSFPVSPTLRVPKPAGGEEYECPECGHENPAGNQFCGMCGAAREDGIGHPAAGEDSEALESAPASADHGAKHHHHHYHHYQYKNNPYLLLAIVLLLGVIAWHQWLEYRRSVASPAARPAQQQVVPQVPAQGVPAQEHMPAAVAPEKPAGQSRQQGLRPGPQAKTRKQRAPVTAPPMLAYPPIARQPMPVLPVFSNTPPPIKRSGDSADQNNKAVHEATPEFR